MTQAFIQQLVSDASLSFRPSGHFAYHYARGKLGHDTIFHELLRLGLLQHGGHVLDLGCGQGSLFAWLLAARRLHDVDRSGWWQLIGFIPLIGWILLIYWLVQPGKEPNRFGPPPQPALDVNDFSQV